MQQTWRWFGPQDMVSIADIAQAGASGIVTALHHVPNGTVWTADEIAKRKAQIDHDAQGKPTGLSWSVVESLVVSETIKRQESGWRDHIAAYLQSLENLAAAGIEVICYNFMPILDWTRTDLGYARPNGARCMRFDVVDFAVFDLFLLARPGAEESFPAPILEAARARHAQMSPDQATALTHNIIAGLPGANQVLSMDEIRTLLASYAGIDADRLRRHHHDFLELVVPTAERLGLRLCCHPDDPPFALLGLPRIMSTEDDYRRLVAAVDSPANGITLCSGSLGARPGADLPGMMRRLGDRVHFLHLRNVTIEGDTAPCSFFEDDHLEGGTDMVALIDAILAEETRRAAAGRADAVIPMRPDHGQDITTDLTRRAQPGYPLVGRLKGLAELRGVERALSAVRAR